MVHVHDGDNLHSAGSPSCISWLPGNLREPENPFETNNSENVQTQKYSKHFSGNQGQKVGQIKRCSIALQVGVLTGFGGHMLALTR